MSESFSNVLAQKVVEYLGTVPLADGQIFSARFPDAATADEFITALLQSCPYGKKQYKIRVSPDKEVAETVTELTIPNQGPIALVRVVKGALTAESSEYQGTAGFATLMRNWVGGARDRGVLLVSDFELETIGRGSEDLADKGGPLDRARLFIEATATDGIVNLHARAILRAIQESIPTNRVGPKEIQTVTEIRTALNSNNYEILPTLVAKLPGHVRDETLGPTFFQQPGNEDELTKAVELQLKQNQDTFRTINQCFQVGVDSQACLERKFDPPMAGQIANAPDWRKLDLTRLRGGLREEKAQRLKQIETTPAKSTLRESPRDTTSQKTDIKSLLIPMSRNEISVRLTFSKDLKETPFEANTAVPHTISKRNEILQLTLSPTDKTAPQYAILRVWGPNETKKSRPRYEFNICLLPAEPFESLRQASLGVDAKGETLLRFGSEPLELHVQDGAIRDTYVRERFEQVAITENHRLIPEASAADEGRLDCRLVFANSAPIALQWVLDATTIEADRIVTPLFLQSIVAPEDWSTGQSRLPSGTIVDLATGTVSLPNGRSFGLDDAALRLLQVEQAIVNQGVLGPFEVPEERLTTPVLHSDAAKLPPALRNAASELLAFFKERGTTPSTDPWGTDTQEAAKKFVEACLEAAPKKQAATFAQSARATAFIGAIRAADGHRTWLTSFHPICMAYALRLAQWRDSELGPKMAGAFRDRRLTNKLTPVGHAPYLQASKPGQLMRAFQYGDSCTWIEFAPRDAANSPTPAFVSRLVVDKLEAFLESYPSLTSVSENRPLVVNVANMGEMGPFVEGLFKLYQNRHHDGQRPIRMVVRILGGDADGTALDDFFDPRSQATLRRKLESRDDEAVELLRSHVTFTKQPEPSGDYPESHVSFVRQMLQQKAGESGATAMPSASLAGGLLVRESLLAQHAEDGVEYTSGYGESHGRGLVEKTANVYNALFAAESSGSFDPGRALKKTTSSTQERQWDRIWRRTMWVVHVEPNVGLDFYLHGRSQHDLVLIHYSDQYDPSSPDYDAITSTIHRGHYEASVNRALREVKLDKVLSASDVLGYLISVDGSMALELQKAKGKQLTEFIGMAGGLAVAHQLLSKQHPTHLWIPLSLAELVRHTRRTGARGDGLFQYTRAGPASDDLCFAGLPTDPTDERVPLWIVETKGGTSRIETGVKQVKGAIRNLAELLCPTQPCADERLVRATLGRVLIDVSTRFKHYGILQSEMETATRNRLLAGEFKPYFPKSQEGNEGLVIQVRNDIAMADKSTVDDVAALRLPSSALSIIKHGNVEKVLPGMNLDQLRLVLSQGPGTPAPPLIHVEEKPGPRVAPEPSLVVLVGESATPGTARPTGSVPKEQPLSPTMRPKPTQQGTLPPQIPRASKAADGRPSQTSGKADWQLLDDVPEQRQGVDTANMVQRIEKACRDLQVGIRPPSLQATHVGPRHISIPVVLKEGQHTSRFLSILDNVALEVRAAGKITAKLSPQEGAIRILVPHGADMPVRLRHYFQGATTPTWPSLQIPLGVDAKNQHHVLDMLSERHALIAGATGSGKSNFLAATILSLALQYTPSQLAISILDPKGLDFPRYANLPHVRQGGTYLDSADACTAYLLDLLEKDLPARKARLQAEGYANAVEYNKDAQSSGDKPVPFHVIIIDEYADLVMSLGKNREEFELAVCRLAQIGRALGYIILLATQRPSADIVSGKIKANFPCRISFRLPSSTDSGVILDESGAQDLLGSGDMILKGQSGELRLQAYFVNSKEAARTLQALAG